jgi:membrane-bound lytic murein transglycosylase D
MAMGPESPELRTLTQAERELFGPQNATGAMDTKTPRVHATGLPPAPATSAPTVAEGGRDIAWLSKLDLPDLPIRWEARLVRYLEFFRDDPRGKATLALWARRSGRYRDAIRKVLKKKGLPEDLAWLAMIESGYDAQARSPAGAVGLWQFMPESGRAYGLSQDRWIDQRYAARPATEAAAEFLADLQRRLGSWELAMAAYNMGYGGLVSVVKRYNTNDYWSLSQLEGALPWETTLYVPKILAAAIAMKNPTVFGIKDVAHDPNADGEEISAPPGTTLAVIAQAAGVPQKELEQLNPELRLSRTPPGTTPYTLRVPAGRGAQAQANLPKLKTGEVQVTNVRFGETLDQVATRTRVSAAKITELNHLAKGESLKEGAVLLLPKGAVGGVPADDKLIPVVVPQEVFVYPGRRRLFHRVAVGDTTKDLADRYHVTLDEIVKWNTLDPSGRLQEGMTLQLFVPADVDAAKTAALGDSEVRVIPVGSEEFFALTDPKGRKRIEVTAKRGDTLASIGQHHSVSPALMERINRRGRNDVLPEGTKVYLYVDAPQSQGTIAANPAPPPAAGAAAAAGGLEPLPSDPR